MIEPIRRLILRYFLPYKWMLDVVVWTSVTILAYLLRFDPTDEVWMSQMVQILPFAALGKLLLVTSFGSYRMSWRNTGFSDFFLIARMVFVYSGLMGIAILTLQSAGTITISLSIAALELLLGIPILLVPRMAARFMLIYHANSKGNGNGFSKAEARRHRVLIVGAGESGTMVARELQKHPEMGMKMIAFVDDKASLQRQKNPWNSGCRAYRTNSRDRRKGANHEDHYCHSICRWSTNPSDSGKVPNDKGGISDCTRVL
jgi:FlaA1/EpsC-like NDP-sugar epimerase